jgi:hypothetical protein
MSVYLWEYIFICVLNCVRKKNYLCAHRLPVQPHRRCAVLQPSLQVASHRQPATSQPDRYRRAFNKQMQIGRSCSCWILSMVAEVGGRLQCLWPCGEESTSACCVLSLTDSGVRVSLSLSVPCRPCKLSPDAWLSIPYLYFHLAAADREEIP